MKLITSTFRSLSAQVMSSAVSRLRLECLANLRASCEVCYLKLRLQEPTSAWSIQSLADRLPARSPVLEPQRVVRGHGLLPLQAWWSAARPQQPAECGAKEASWRKGEKSHCWGGYHSSRQAWLRPNWKASAALDFSLEACLGPVSSCQSLPENAQ